MSARVRVVIPARNEQGRLGALLDSVQRARAFALEQAAKFETEVWVVLDRCTDGTRQIAARAGSHAVDCPAPGGKVECLRAALAPEIDVHLVVDADVVLGRRTLFDLVQTLLAHHDVLAACPPLLPLPIAGVPTPLSWALHRYNAARGYSSERLWLSGRCYALRFTAFPDAAQMRQRAQLAATQSLDGPLLADDVWLSRALLAQHPHAIRHIDTDAVAYRAPATLRGMSRTYRRMRRELRRIDLLFPELPGPGRDREVDQLHSARDRLAFAIFQVALTACKAHARWEDALHRLSATTPDPWPVVSESKR